MAVTIFWVIRLKFPLSYDNMIRAERIYQTVSTSPFTGGIAAEIIGMPARNTGSFFGALKNSNVIEYSHESPRKNRGRMITGNPLRWYKFTREWIEWKQRQDQAHAAV